VPRETHNIISSHIPGGWMCADCGMKEPKLSLRECPAALITPAPAVSRDEIVAVLEDIKARGLPDRYKSDVELSDRLDAILSRLRGEGE
jgi:hypothetical protein